MERHRRSRFEQLAVDCREDAHIVIGARRRGDDSVVVVDDLEELTDDKRHGLDALDLLLSAHELALQVGHLILDVLLLDVEELQVLLQRLHPGVQVCLRGARALACG